MGAEAAILEFGAKKVAVYSAKKLLRDHLSVADAAKYEKILGIDSPDIEAELAGISEKIDRVSDLVKEVQQDVLMQHYDNHCANMRGMIDGYVNAFRLYRDFAKDNQKDFAAGIATDEQKRKLEELDQNLQGNRKTVLN